MTRQSVRPNYPVSDRLHPVVYKALIGLALWFVLGAWGFFAPGGYIGLALAVVTGLVLVAVALPYILSRIWNRYSPAASVPAQSFADWLASEFEVWDSRLKSSEAAVEALVPIVAVALGMTAFAIVWSFAS